MCIFKFLFGSNRNTEQDNSTSKENQDDMDDLDFDEMNDIWDEMDDF